MNVKMAKFTDVVRDVSGGNAKLLQSAFQQSGALAVVDQGQDFVAGFTDDEAYRFRTEALPVVVFGDHTKTIKYIDFPFAMGADGVKVLKPTDECDAKYLYHYLRQARLPDAGYSRHFKFLKELHIPVPPLPEQRRIAALLDKTDALRVKRREAIAKLDQLLQSVFLDMFGNPIQNSRHLPVVCLADVVETTRPITYGILKPGPDTPAGIPYVRVVDIRDGGVIVSGVRRTTVQIANSYKRSTIRTGDLLMSIRGHVGRIGLVPAELDGANITQDTARVSVSRGFESGYIAGLLNTDAIQQHMKRFTRGAAVKGINLKHVREIPVPVPPPELQKRYSRTAQLIATQKRGCEKQLGAASSMFDALQRQAFFFRSM